MAQFYGGRTVFGWSDGQKAAIGFGLKRLKRRSPTVQNLAWDKAFMWDGRFGSLEEQAWGPISSHDEMNMDSETLVSRIEQLDGYRKLFGKVFQEEGVTPKTISMALAAYERTLISELTPFDHWVAGDELAIGERAKRGFELFNGKARCAKCHSGWKFSDNSFHDIGLPGNDLGRGEYFPEAIKMQRAFKTVGLRDLGQRGPFMHDGSIETLEQVIEHYDKGGIDRPSRSDLITPLNLSENEKSDLVAFLATLSNKTEFVQLPELPR